MARKFPSVKDRLLVGIGGGVPSTKHDIRLGDVVVSPADDQYDGVIQYDQGRIQSGSPTILRTAVLKVQSDRLSKGTRVKKYISEKLQRRCF